MRIALICALVVAGAVGATTATAVAARSGVPPGTFSGCPHDTRPLPGRPLAAYAPTVRKAVLQFVRTSFVHLFKTPPKIAGARTTQVFLVTNWLPSGWIKRECGIALWRRSVGVSVYFPAMDPPHNPVGHCNACSHLVFLASRTLGGWTVWGDY